jgi:hypothetical protein
MLQIKKYATDEKTNVTVMGQHKNSCFNAVFATMEHLATA